MDGYREISLYALFARIFKKLWIVAITIIVFGTSAFIITDFAIKPQYNATIRLYANNKTEDTSLLTSSDVSASKSLVSTYITIIKSNSFAETIAEKVGLGYSSEQIRNMISADSVNGTEVFDVSVTGAVPKDCAIIANEIAELAPGRISEIVNGSSVKIIDRAETPSQPISPSLPKNVATACFLGMVSSCVAIAVTYVHDTTIYNESDIKKFCSLPILGIFPDLSEVGQGDFRYTYVARSTEK
ncbi:MAG: Wzz/FepE/Etk N-terminal domain-containing protein [Oscillospiraceae bacterium]|nr:Wzz/FepE/Etk N-terminal domain-containing protein [Oscillospiraceae bacterium]